MSVVGARPQFVKLAPIAREVRERGLQHSIIHTGQHYDPLLSDVFFTDFDISQPDLNLNVGSGTHGRQTGQILSLLDDVLATCSPDAVLVYGDTNSTLAAALAAVKHHVPVAHIEAGLRSFNRKMPEEHNRVLTDHASDLLLAPTELAMRHLEREGLGERARLVGDLMADVVFALRARMEHERTPTGYPQPNEDYYVATIHRAENTDDPTRLRAILDSLAQLPAPTLLLAHPRLLARSNSAGIELSMGSLQVRDPLPYPQLLKVLMGARALITDSGGLQKEAFLLGVPCTTVRTETEWAETLEAGWNVLAEPGSALLSAAVRPRPVPVSTAPYGTGRAAFLALEAVLSAGWSR